MTDRPKLSDFIKIQLRQKGWSGVDFGVMIGCPKRSAVSKIINGKQPPSLHQIPRIAAMFDVTVDDVVQMRLVEELAELPEATRSNNVYKELIKVYKAIPVSEMIRRNWASVRDKEDPVEFLKVL